MSETNSKNKNKTKIKNIFKLKIYKSSLRFQLIGFFLICGLIPISVASILTYQNSSNTMKDTWNNNLEAIALAKKEEINSWFAERKSNTLDFSQNPSTISNLEIITNSTQSESNKTTSLSNIQRSMQSFLKNYPFYHEMYILNTSGIIVAGQNNTNWDLGHSIGNNQASKDYFIVCSQNEATSNFLFLADYRWSSNSNYIQLTLSAPIHSGSKFIGILVFFINSDFISDLMHDTQGLGHSGETYLVNRQYQWLTTSKFDYYTKDGEYPSISDTLLNASISTTEGAIEANANEDSVITKTNIDYRENLVMGVYIHFDLVSEIGNTKTNWILVTEIDQSEAMQGATSLLQSTIIIGAVSAVIIILYAYLIASTISNPIKELSKVSKNIAKGDYQVKINEIKGKGEIGDLVTNFTQMKENVLNALEYSENIIKGTPLPIFTVDKDFNIQKANSMISKIFNYNSDEEIIGKKCYEIFQTEVCNTERCFIRNAWKFERSTTPQDLLINIPKSDKKVEFRITAAPIYNNQGEQIGGLEVLQDVNSENQIYREIENSVEDISSSVEELTSNSEEVSAASENIASTQQQLAKGSSEQVMAIIETQREIKELSNGIATIREKIDNIGIISDLIRDVAGQTNMLALNAAIEAARAGEAGRGFNVVADQVRKLAEESKSAVVKTEEMVKDVQEVSARQGESAKSILKQIDAIAAISEQSSASTEEAASAAEEQASSMDSVTITAQQLMNIAKQLEKLLSLRQNYTSSQDLKEIKKTNKMDLLVKSNRSESNLIDQSQLEDHIIIDKRKKKNRKDDSENSAF
ncbi:MAG: methyl-accepting chemotaxis protein [Promethearchaeota archaeon]